MEERKLMQTLLPLQVGYRKRGQCGVEISDWWPHLAECADDIAFIRSTWTTDNDHGAQLQFHTGRQFFQGYYPSVGSWVHYGLGTLNENLPQFVVLGPMVATNCGGFASVGGIISVPSTAACNWPSIPNIRCRSHVRSGRIQRRARGRVRIRAEAESVEFCGLSG